MRHRYKIKEDNNLYLETFLEETIKSLYYFYNCEESQDVTLSTDNVAVDLTDDNDKNITIINKSIIESHIINFMFFREKRPDYDIITILDKVYQKFYHLLVPKDLSEETINNLTILDIAEYSEEFNKRNVIVLFYNLIKDISFFMIHEVVYKNIYTFEYLSSQIYKLSIASE